MRFRRYRQQEEVSVNITPLIDVVFLLLIFFMVTTTFTRETQLQISLPESQSQQELTEDKSIEILIDRNGTYAINGEVLIRNDTDFLKKALNQRRLDNSTRVILTADSKAEHQAFIYALDAVSQLGFYNISITTQQEQTQ